MTLIDFSLRMNTLSSIVTSEFVKKIYSKTDTFDDFDNYSDITIPFIFVEDASLDDMIGVVISDFSEIVLFTKELKENDKGKKIKCCFTITKKLLNFAHYESGTILANSISELVKVEPDLVKETCTFYDGDEQLVFEDITDFFSVVIKVDDNIIQNKITDLLPLCKELKGKLGYYIPREGYGNINCFKTLKTNYDYDESVESLMPKMNNPPSKKNISGILQEITKLDPFQELIKDFEKSANSQSNIILISKFVIDCLFPILFNPE